LSALYRVAPLGDKAPADLALVFSNRMFGIFAFEVLIGGSAGLRQSAAPGQGSGHS